MLASLALLASVSWSLPLSLLLALAACTPPLRPAPSPPPPVDISPVAAADPGSRLPGDWRHGVFAEIYVRGYRDSDGDGIGDLRGLIERLDYLRELGVSGLWLMPVMRSQDRDHGYAVVDYRAIEPDYGTLADFDELLAQAHARGIGIVIDYVINHSAAENPLFLNARSAPANPHRDWYVWQPRAPRGWSIYGTTPWYDTGQGAYFAGFWDQMPDFDLRNPAVLRYHQDNLRFWLNRGVDGFRFDAVGNLVENGPDAWENQPENVAVMAAMRQVVGGYANRYMVCESPAAPRMYGGDDACGGSFAFDHRADLLGAADGAEASIRAAANYFVDAPPGMATILSNHDAFAGERPWDRFSGDLARYRLAAATLLLQPGTPFVYYGEEIGLAGGAGLRGDPRLRTPMSWTGDPKTGGFTTGRPFRLLSANVATHNVAAEAADAGSLLNFYRRLIALRTSRPSLRRGAYEAPAVDGRVMSFRRTLGGERTLVVFNYGRREARAEVAGLPAGAALAPLGDTRPAGLRADADGRAAWPIPPQSFAVFSVDAPP